VTDRDPEQPRLGDLLVAAGAVSESELQLGLAEQRERDTPIGMTLVRLGFLDEPTLVRALASQLNLPVVSLKGKRINNEILELVAVATVEKHRCLPLLLNRDGDQPVLYLGIEDPTATTRLQEISAEIGMAVQPVIVGPTELDECIHRHYHWESSGVSSLDPGLQATPLPVRRSPNDSSEPKSLANSSSPLAMGELASGGDEVGFDSFTDEPDSDEEFEFVGGFDTEPNPELSASELFVESEPGSDPSDGNPIEKSRTDMPDVLEFAAPTTSTGQPAASSTPASDIQPNSGARANDSMLRAIAQLLIEKGVFTRDELVDRLRAVSKEES